MGYGLIRTQGKSKVELIEMGALHLGKIKDHALKLKRIYDRVSGLIEAHAPDEMAVEAPFFGQNVQSMLKLGRAQGVALAAALAREVPVAEYAPRRVKQAVTGSGAASKEQVAGMVQRTLQIPPRTCPRIWTPQTASRWPCVTIFNCPPRPCKKGAADGKRSFLRTRIGCAADFFWPRVKLLSSRSR